MDNINRRLDSYFEGINNLSSTNNDIPIEDMIAFIKKSYSENWKTGYDYSNIEPKEFKSMNIDSRFSKEIYAPVFISYIYKLFRYLSTGNSDGIDEWAIKEFEEWEIKGGNCIYLSVLLYSLLRHGCKICPDCIKYVQGFYRHEIRSDYPSFLPWNGQHNGLHAWITVNGAIIDISIMQQELFFDFKHNLMVFGEIPEGLIYMGFEETDDTVKSYLKDILEFSKMPYELWIRKHQLNALHVGLNNLT